MDKTTGSEANRKSGNTNTSTSDHQSGSEQGSGSSTSRKQAEKIDQVNVVDQGSPAEVVVEINAESKAEMKAVPKRKAPAKKKAPVKKDRSEAEKVKDIQGLLEGVFMVASLKAGEHWQLSADESKQIAQPLARILDRYDLLSKASEVSDPVALIVASATIVMPRVMITKMSADQKKAETLKKNGVIGNVEKRVDPVASGSGSGSSPATTSTHDGQFIKAVSSEIQTGF